MSAGRCPTCDAPLATEADLPEDGLSRPEHASLCWRAFNRDTCRRPPVDWRARAIQAETTLALERSMREAAERAVERLNRECATLRKRLHNIAAANGGFP